MLAVIHLFMVVVSLRVGWAFGSELQNFLGAAGWLVGIVPAAWFNYSACERIQRLLLTFFAPNETITSGDLRDDEPEPMTSAILGPRSEAEAMPFKGAKRSPRPGFFRTLGCLILVGGALAALAMPAVLSWALGFYAAQSLGLAGWMLGAPAGYALGFAGFQLGDSVLRNA